VTKSFYTYNGTEDLLRQLVIRHGAVLATLQATSKGFKKYKGGVFEGCEAGVKVDHAITVVGYGRAQGKDFWLIKNSWGEGWGERGFMRLRRGVGMCGIGRSFSAIECEPVADCSADDEDCEPDGGDGEDGGGGEDGGDSEDGGGSEDGGKEEEEVVKTTPTPHFLQPVFNLFFPKKN
jgi:hypothetical protein